MAKFDPKKAAAAAGIKVNVPKAPKMPKAPKAPKIPNAAALKKQADEAAKKRIKVLKKVLIALAIATVTAILVYYFVIYRTTPEYAFRQVVEHADKAGSVRESALFFRDSFTEQSKLMVRVCPKDATQSDHCHEEEEQAWLNLAKGLSPLHKEMEVKITHEPFAESEKIDDPDLARINYHFDDTDHLTYMRRENGAWKVALNEGIDPTKVTLPEGTPEEVKKLFKAKQKGAAYWDKTKKGAQGKFDKFLDKIMFWKSSKIKIGR